MCREKCHPKARRCPGDSPVAVASRGKARYACKTVASLTPAPREVKPEPARAKPSVDAETRDIEILRTVAARIDDAFGGEDPQARQALSEEYGSPLGAIRALGSAVTSRAEELAGITADEVVSSWQDRRDAAKRAVSDAHAAAAARHEEGMREFDAWAEENHPGVDWRDTEGSGSLRALRNAYVSDEYKAAVAAREAAEEFWEKSGIQGASDTETRMDMRRLSDGYEAAVAEIRPLGGDLALHELSDAAAVKVANEAISIYPADWVAASSAAGPLAVAVTSGRSSHNPFSVSSERVSAGAGTLIAYAGATPSDTAEREHLSVEPGFDERGPNPARDRWLTQTYEVKRTKRRPKGVDWEEYETGVWRRKTRGRIDGPGLELNLSGNKVHGRPSGFAVAAHEMGHRMQTVVPGLSAMEDAWLTDRTTVNGERDELVPLWEGSAEMVRPDNFVDAYIGKEYTDMVGDVREATEVITMGTQALFGGDHGGLIGMNRASRDDDMRHFILGAMAAAGGKAR